MYTSKDSISSVISSMFPFGPAMGVTNHISQGMTTEVVVFHSSKFESRRHWHVALSRVTFKKGLFIDGDFQIPEDEPSTTDEDIERMRRECPLQFTLQFPQAGACDEYSYFIFHNRRSLHKHHRMLQIDKAFSNSACMMLVETRLVPSDQV